MSKFIDKVTILVRARYPLVWLETDEETRAIQLLEKVALEQSKKLVVWSSTSGLTTLDGTSVGENTRDPEGALIAIQENKEHLMVVLKDLHKFLPEQDTIVYRKLRDMYDSLKATSKTIFILSPVVKIPRELSKSISVLTLPLPERDELETVLQSIMDGLEEVGKKGDKKALAAFERIKEQLAHNGTKDSILSAGMGLTMNEFEDVLTKSLVQTHEIDVSVIISEKEQIIKKAGMLEFYSIERLSSMGDVGGLKAMKLWIKKRKLAYSEKAKAYGLKTPKGFMAIGFPGTGKSLIAKAAAQYMQMPMIRLDMSEIASKWYGETTNKIKQALNLAEAVSPCIFWWDEVEKMFGSTGQGTHEETMRAISTILTWMQELDKPVFIIATCNEPTSLNPALMRAGRFDEVFYVDLPSQSEREEIFEIHIRKIKRNPTKFDIKQLAENTVDYSGAEIEACVQDALNTAFFEESEINTDYILKSITSIVPLSQKRKDDLTKLREWGKTNASPANAEGEITEKKKKVNRKIDL